MLEEERGKKLPAKRVFSMVIKFLKDDLIDECNKQLANEIKDKDIRWVLTVPAIWNDVAKQFMREAAMEAGLRKNNLVIALEPEAASIFCRHLPVEKGDDLKASLASMKAGTKYIVLDAGGGTVDITVHQVVVDDKLREIHKVSGGAWGGTRVDDEYETFLAVIVGSDVMKAFKREHMDDYIDVFRAFEVKKRDISLDDGSMVTIRIPTSLNEVIKRRTGKEITDMLAQSKFKDKIKYVSGKIRIDANILQAFFKRTVAKIIEHTRMLLKEDSCKGCSTILMVGGFSESRILQDAVRKSFPGMIVIIPDSAGLVVLKGAVIFGHKPTAVIERVCRYTYGLNRQHRTSERKCKHPPTITTIEKDGILRCQNIFKIYIKSGQTVKLGEEQAVKTYNPRYADQTSVSFYFVASTSPKPVLVTEDGCFKLGKLNLPIEDTSLGITRKFDTYFIFGGTEIVAKVVDRTTGNTSFLSIDCLE